MADVVHAFIDSPNYKRGALFIDLRRVGRLLRPRAPAARARRPRQHRPRRGLRPDGLPHPGGGVSPVRAPGQDAGAGRGRLNRAGAWTTASTPTSRSSSFISLPLRARRPEQARIKYANNIGRSFDWERPDFEPPDLPDPPAIVTQPCALGGGDVHGHARRRTRATWRDSSSSPSATRLPVYEGKPDESSRSRTRSRRASRPRPTDARGPVESAAHGDPTADRRRAGRGRRARRWPSRTRPPRRRVAERRRRRRRSRSTPPIAARARGRAGVGPRPRRSSARSCCTRWPTRLRALTDELARVMTLEGGKPLVENSRRGRLDRRRVRLLRRDGPQLRRPRDPVDRVDPAGARPQGADRRVGLHRALELPAAAARRGSSRRRWRPATRWSPSRPS